MELKSFDDQADFFEKDGDKKDKREQAKLEKIEQFERRQSKVRIDIRKKEAELKKSIIAPHMDTFQIAMDLELLKKEKAIIDRIFAQVFPTEAAESSKN
jgi:hypothetical protein